MSCSINHRLNKSVLKLAAHSPKVCDINGNIFGSGYIAECIKNAKKFYSMKEIWIVDLILSNGLRVSEVLGIRQKDIVNDRTVRIQGKKGSKDRVCMLLYSDGLDSLKSDSEDLVFDGLSRYYVYRFFKRLGIIFAIPGQQKNAVTHAGRHVRIQTLAQAGVELNTIKEYIGHKSVRSTMHYAKGKNK